MNAGAVSCHQGHQLTAPTSIFRLLHYFWPLFHCLSPGVGVDTDVPFRSIQQWPILKILACYESLYDLLATVWRNSSDQGRGQPSSLCVLTWMFRRQCDNNTQLKSCDLPSYGIFDQIYSSRHGFSTVNQASSRIRKWYPYNNFVTIILVGTSCLSGQSCTMHGSLENTIIDGFFLSRAWSTPSGIGG